MTTGRRQLRDRVNGIARRSLSPVPLPLWEKAFPKDLIALCYHMVSDEDLEHFALYPYKNSAQFEADVLFARERAVTYRAVVESRLRNAPLPPNGVLFTFDDGMAECYSVVRPILLRNGVDAVFFVTTNYIDEREAFGECTLSRCLTAAAAAPLERVEAILASLRIDGVSNPSALRRLASMRLATDQPTRRRLFIWLLGLDDRNGAVLAKAEEALGIRGAGRKPYFMSSAEVRQLAADGFTVGAHGLRHHSLEGREPREIEEEIVASCEAVRELTGQTRVPFAFPYSGLAVERSAVRDIMRRNPLVELVFDSGCLRRDPNFIVNRVFADTPPRTPVTNLPATLRDAWSIPSAWFRAASA